MMPQDDQQRQRQQQQQERQEQQQQRQQQQQQRQRQHQQWQEQQQGQHDVDDLLIKPPQPSNYEDYERLPIAQPVTAYSPHVPLVPPAPSPPAADEGFLKETFRLALFHALNGVLGHIGFIAVIFGAVLGVALIPLCCFGIVVLRLALWVIGFLAHLDVALYNFIAPAHERVIVREDDDAYGPSSGFRLARGLSSFSPGGLLAALYFVTAKLALGMMSCVALALTFSFPVTYLTDDDVAGSFGGLGGSLLAALITGFLLVLGSAFMSFAASISRAATRFFCCEKLTLDPYTAHRVGALAPTAYTCHQYGAIGPQQPQQQHEERQDNTNTDRVYV